MGNVAIRIENVGKQYQIGQGKTAAYETLADRIVSTVQAPFKRIGSVLRGESSAVATEHIWALRDVSFEVQHGEVVGIIGRNGAGKSTLLKILSQITEPTKGSVDIYGRVGALLEVGTGFHPELTGRENVYLNGAILGMTRHEIARKFDEIVDFSGVEQFIDTPVKHYSSGMQMRLAFAVAAHLEPEILIVDEVLAVGDAEFQKKCLGKMSDVTKEGRTVLFVSHNMGAVRSLCTRGVVLAQGSVNFMGSADEAIDYYLRNITSSTSRMVSFPQDPSRDIDIQSAYVYTLGKDETDTFDVADQLTVEITYVVRAPVRGSNLSFALSRDGTLLFRSWDIDLNRTAFEMRQPGSYVARLHLPQGILLPGLYSIYLAAARPKVGPYAVYPDCLVFEIENNSEDWTHTSFSRGGEIMMRLNWEIEPSQ